MVNKTIDVKADVSEVSHGREYTGSISFNGMPFHYSYKFDLPIKELSRLEEGGSIEDKIHLEIIGPDGKPLVVDDKSRTLIVAATWMLVDGFYKFQSSGLSNLAPELSDNVGMYLSQSALGISTSGRPEGNRMQTQFQLKKEGIVDQLQLEQLLQRYIQ